MLMFVSLIKFILNCRVAACCEDAEIYMVSFLIRWTSGLVIIWLTKASNDIGGWRLGRYAG